MNSITVIGRKWFDKINGNTYHTATILIDGEHKPELDIPFQYGYGDQYLQSAGQLLDEAGLVSLERHPVLSCSEGLRSWCDRNNVTLYYQADYLPRKKDL